MSKGEAIQLGSAEHIAGEWLDDYRRTCAEDATIHICGSIRRKAKIVHDIDLLVIDEKMHGTLSKTEYKGIPMQLYFVKPECEGAGLLFLTGPANFNISLRRAAKIQGLKLNRYGLWKGDVCIASKTEEDIFKAIGMDYIAPEDRGDPSAKKQGIMVQSGSSLGDRYEVFVKDIHGFYFCTCRGFKYRRDCRHLKEALDTV